MIHEADPHRRGERSGFTLLEMMAVVVILGLTAAMVLPNLSATENAVLRSQAREIAAALEYARQRAALTGYPHRMLLNIDEGLYRIEWFVSEDEADPESAAGDDTGPAPGGDVATGAPISLSPPQTGIREYRPIPGPVGRDEWLDRGLVFAGVDTPEGWLETGEVAVVFDRDGTTDSAEIEIDDPSGRGLVLEVRPLLDVVRIRESDRSG